jgi:5-methylcytosine-specific restriction endonuclease McrA
VLDKQKKALMPCSEKRARLLLERGRAVVHRRTPFTIRLKDRTIDESPLQPLRLKLDPGAAVTGFAVLREDGPDQATAVVLGEIHHRRNIKRKLDARRSLRRARRTRKLRYRQPRFLNRHPAKCANCGRNAQHGGRYCRPCAKQRAFSDNDTRDVRLPPSLEARVQETLSAVDKLRSLLPITAVSSEHVKFDTQLLQNPDIEGIEYQQGTLAGYNVREYLLEKWGRKCAYCGAENVPLQIEHIIPRQPRGGPVGNSRVTNLTLACETCNREKGNLQPKEWLVQLEHSTRAKDRERAANLRYVLANCEEPLQAAALMNATRWRLYRRLQRLGLPLEVGSGAMTKYNRTRLGLPKAHFFDACAVGPSTPPHVTVKQSYVQIWRATGRGSRQMCRTDKYGFPARHKTRQKMHFGFMSGDLVEAQVPSGKYAGRWVGWAEVRASGRMDLYGTEGKMLCGTSYRHARLLQRASGWRYGQAPAVSRDGARIGTIKSGDENR